MKKLLALTFLVGLAGTTTAQDVLVNTLNRYSIDMYQRLKPDSTNFFVSPFGLHTALAIANEGATGQTRIQLDALLYPGMDSISISDYRKLLLATKNLEDPIIDVCRQTTMSTDTEIAPNVLFIHNSVWIQKQLNVLGNYRKKVHEEYLAQLFEFEMTTVEDVTQHMNDWIRVSTQQKINSISPIKEETQMRIINSIYFNGAWAAPFDQNKTITKRFFSLGQKTAVKMMNAQRYYRFFEDSRVKVLRLPYACEQFEMIAILPQTRYELNQIEAQLSAEQIAAWIKSASPHEVKVHFPIFKISTDLSPITAIIQAGCQLPFSDFAEFSSISTSKKLKIGEVNQKTEISVDENATEAASATTIDFVVTAGNNINQTPPPPKIFNANHPFLFLIMDNRTRVILFVGRYAGQ